MIPNSEEFLLVSQQMATQLQIQQKLKETKRTFILEQAKLEQAKNTMNEEFRDVKSLETLTLKAIWYDLLNKKFSELEREQREYYEAKLMYESIATKVDKLTTEIKNYESELIGFNTLKEKYDELIKQKIRFLALNQYPIFTQIVAKQEALVKIKTTIKEVEDALDAAKNMLEIIPAVIDDLKDARSFATWDMLGGGMGATYLKRQKMKKAKFGIVEINYALDKLKRELKDVEISLSPNEIKLTALGEFTDYFLDNFWFALSQQNDLENTYKKTHTFLNEIFLLKERLVSKKKQYVDLYDQEKQALDKLVEQA